MNRLHSRRLVLASMRLRPLDKPDFLNRRLHPVMRNKLVQYSQALQPLAYKLHPQNSVQSYEQPHPEPLGTLENIPFSVSRTNSGNLPVYIQYRNQHVIKRTIIRHLTGSIQQFVKQLKKVVGNREVRVKTGSVVIPGVHKESVQRWLLRIGF